MSFFYVGAPIASALLIFGLRMKELGTKRALLHGLVRERLTFRLFLLAGILMLAGSLLEYLWREERLRWLTFLPGWGLAIASFMLRRQAIAALDRFWSLHVEIRPNHELVQTGPFRWIRHPTYLSMILEIIAGGLILNAFFTLAVVILIFVPTLIYRLRIEEHALLEKFGDAYRDYQHHTPAIIPYKWPTIKII